ncbi:MAG: response regulator [Nitrospina sp.]|jgi:DNA-binding NtrC family response regulator|nr:response regulator [Nitrospina sp.]MBT3416128.1 response regulator [Nitrospina sp.]MBT3857642.1 response regulator [Nitrospina sp.]MBT4105719.1 response regulator [Nitrospina sp.]MBT4388558.1 response regulator [Nitrospina sp.]
MNRILIVDDNPKQLMLLKLILEDSGFQVVSKNSGRQAIKFIEENGPTSIILSDFNMEEMTGLEFFKAVKTISPHSYRILSSCNHNIDNLATHIKEADIHCFLRKPFRFKEVIEQAKAGAMHYSAKSSNRQGVSK